MVIAIAVPAGLHLGNEKGPKIFARSVTTIFPNGFKVCPESMTTVLCWFARDEKISTQTQADLQLHTI